MFMTTALDWVKSKLKLRYSAKVWEDKLQIFINNATEVPNLKHPYYSELLMHKARLAFSKLPIEKSPIFMGLEWEVNFDFNTQEWVQRAFKTGNCKQFLNFRAGGGPIEIVSVPASMLWLKKMLQENFFAHGLNKDFKHNTNHGLHIHIGKKYFTEASLKKFIAFISRLDNAKFIESISGRSLRETRWCQPTVVMFINKVVAGKSVIVGCNLELDKKLQQVGVYRDHKGIAVNTRTLFDTVELRIFSSCVTKRDLFSRMEFTEALIHFCKKADWNELTAKDFTKFVLQFETIFPNLIQVLHSKKLV